MNANFLEMNGEDMLNVTGGSGLLAVLEVLALVSGIVGGAYVQKKNAAEEEAYQEAYDAEMLRLNLENPVPWGDIIRESYE